ncbi:MAG: DNA mismatch repair protein MutS [Magnetovibrio sp.]|nr:DNA mismatch repair protein MutS [Magnetovibrio sp.]
MNSEAPKKPDKPAAGATPMMVQFLSIKEDHPDALLFYRMGDFYELFFEDAEKAAGALDITLTKRGKHNGDDIPMCGVPVHSHEQYLSRLIRKGYRVAVCEQTEDPAEAKKRGAKSVVRRDVVRVVTPGTITEDSLLDARSNNYLAAVAEAQGELGLAWIDVSTGQFFAQSSAQDQLGAQLARLKPGELLYPDSLINRNGYNIILGDWPDALTPQPASRFDSTNGRKRIEALFGVKTLEAFGGFSRAEVAAAGALLDYVELTQKGKLPRITPLVRISAGGVMEIDAATRRNLELSETLTGTRKGSLLAVMDRTITGAGARLLAERLAAPLTHVEAIEERFGDVQFGLDQGHTRDDVRALLSRCPDLERALTRITLGRGGPRDLAAIKDGLALSADARDLFQGKDVPSGLATSLENLGEHGGLVGELNAALSEELPVLARDGGYVRTGYRPDLDELKTLRDESRRLIAGLQGNYQTDTGIASLKVKHNNVLGYFIEVPAKQGDKMMEDVKGGESPYIHRQTMANAVRFSTVELSELEGKIARAADGAVALELEVFEQLVARVVNHADVIATAARALAELDVAFGLAQLALDARLTRPVVDDSRDFEISQGRHPVVEAALEAGEGEKFVANDCTQDDEDGRLWLLTGPNMAGKSTFLRQNALIAVMAQMGSFVPAASARIGVVDRLFSRVGAADDLARGRSTFMVEMVETAAILNQAGERALVILDEIGRGTSTFDGLSIAWAVIEHLHEVNTCRALFATHYHELTALQAKLDGLSCHAMKVKEWKGEVVFLHEVGPGAADRSYGIHVGQLAGLPPAVVTRAEQILKSLEEGEQSSTVTKLADDLPLFSHAPANPGGANAGPRQSSEVEDAVKAVLPDEMTPREALDFLYRLKGMDVGD